MVSKLSDKDYKFIYNRVPRACVDIVIKSKEGILLIKREIEPYKGKYSLPGGGIKFGESIEKAINRIAMAELGYPVVIHKLIGYMEFLREKKGVDKRHSISTAFLCSFKKENYDFLYFKKIGHNNNIHPVHKEFLITHNLLK